MFFDRVIVGIGIETALDYCFIELLRDKSGFRPYKFWPSSWEWLVGDRSVISTLWMNLNDNDSVPILMLSGDCNTPRNLDE